MALRQHLPHILKLTDDPSPVVRQAVRDAFEDFGPDLPAALAALDPAPTEQKLDDLAQEFATVPETWLLFDWEACFYGDDEWSKLEAAQSLLARFLNGFRHRPELGPLLDSLAGDADAAFPAPGPRELARFLFGTRRLGGNRLDYYHPQNSNLVRVLETRVGIPLSLACIYMLVGRRLGLAIHGCNYPGHFLARAETSEGEELFVDCFSGGRIFRRRELLVLHGGAPHVHAALSAQPATAAQIMARSLRNLIHSYQRLHQKRRAEFLNELLQSLKAPTP